MIRRQKLINQINLVMDIEKRLVPLFNKHISTSLNFSRLKKEDKKFTTEQFQIYALMIKKHTEILKAIKRDIESGERNVY